MSNFLLCLILWYILVFSSIHMGVSRIVCFGTNKLKWTEFMESVLSKLASFQIWDFTTGRALEMSDVEVCSALTLMSDNDKVVFARSDKFGGGTNVVVWDLLGNQPIKHMRYDAPVGNNDYVHHLALSQVTMYTYHYRLSFFLDGDIVSLLIFWQTVCWWFLLSQVEIVQSFGKKA